MARVLHILYQHTQYEQKIENLPRKYKNIAIASFRDISRLRLEMPLPKNSSLQDFLDSQDTNPTLCNTLFAEARARNLLHANYEYKLYFSLHQHLYDENLYECEAYFLPTFLSKDSQKFEVVSADIVLLGEILQNAFVYVGAFGILCVVQNGKLLSTQECRQSEAEQKYEALKQLFGEAEFYALDSLQELILPFCVEKLCTKTPYNLPFSIVAEFKEYLCRLKNTHYFLRSNFGIFAPAEFSFARKSLITLCFGICVAYPLMLFFTLNSLQNTINSLQNENLFARTNDSTLNSTLQELQNTLNTTLQQNKELAYKSAFIPNLFAPHLESITRDVFEHLQKQGVWIDTFSIARGEKMLALKMQANAKAHTDITKLLKSLSSAHTQATLSRIDYKDTIANAEILLLVKKDFSTESSALDSQVKSQHARTTL
ncbi:hypothetical protein [Helicobacter himalayensis]|uniref:hypothetical protein n=1 Tax=Helicobacter himalayensis TaxID=1591088 RepID=UPI000829D540|nr:hypothetical protein [Helicobacter himalayensis]